MYLQTALGQCAVQMEVEVQLKPIGSGVKAANRPVITTCRRRRRRRIGEEGSVQEEKEQDKQEKKEKQGGKAESR